MANAAPKKRPMRSRRSGVKKAKQYMANWEVLKKLGAFALVIMLFSSCVVVVPARKYHPRMFGRTIMHPRHFEESRHEPLKWR